MNGFPTPHFDKLNAALENEKMPKSEIPRLKDAIKQYHQWIENMNNVEGKSEVVIPALVNMLNKYKYYIDYDLIFSSEQDFLYRQKGQLKLDNTIVEEFLPYLVLKSFPQLSNNINLGPAQCFSAIYFRSSLRSETNGGES